MRRKCLSLFQMVIAGIFTVAGLFATVPLATAGPLDLFSTPGPVQADPAKPNDPTVMRQRTVALNLSALAQNDTAGTPPAIRFNLFDDVALTGTIDQTSKNPSGTVSLVGRIQDEYLSSWTIVRNGDKMVANIHTLRGEYQLRFDDTGTHSVRQIDVTKFPESDDAIPVNNPPQQKDAGATPPTGKDDGAIIDVMVIYTPAARIAAGGTTAMNTLVDLAVTESNTAYANSNVTQRLRLVYKGEVTYTEQSLTTDLNNLTGTTEGFMDNVHLLRNAYAADEVILLIHNPSACGLAWQMTNVSSSFASLAFGVVHHGCATGTYSFAHELGHTMGLRHDVFVDASTTPYSYAHGYVNVSERWRTVMAYDDKCVANSTSCTRLQYFSNPGKTHPSTGSAMGDAQADASTALNNTTLTVANWRDSTTATGHTLTITTGPSGAPNPTPPETAVNLNVLATDSLGLSLSYQWTASCSNFASNGTFSSSSIQNPTWTSPPNTTGSTQSCTLSVTASDGLGTSTTGAFIQTITAYASTAAFSARNAHKVVSPYWQADPGVFSFIAISHPSLANMSPQIGVRAYAVNQEASTLFGPVVEFTINRQSTKRLIIAPTNHTAINPTNFPNTLFISGTVNGSYGSMVFNPVASNPGKLLTTSAGIGYPDITALSFWGAIMISGTATGFAMEFVGDLHDSVSTGSNPTRSVTSGVN